MPGALRVSIITLITVAAAALIDGLGRRSGIPHLGLSGAVLWALAVAISLTIQWPRLAFRAVCGVAGAVTVVGLFWPTGFSLALAGAASAVVLLGTKAVPMSRSRFPSTGTFYLSLGAGVGAGLAAGRGLAGLPDALAGLPSDVSLGLATGLVLVCVWLRRPLAVQTVETPWARYVVGEDPLGFRILTSNGINHGGQIVDREKLGLPAFYYEPGSPPASVLAMLEPGRVAMIGLGIGAACAYAAPGSRWTIYELDAEIVKLARGYFTCLERCEGDVEIRLGDARRSLTEAPPHEFDLILLDAYVGRDIPLHLSDIGALTLYRSKLKENGAVLVHASSERSRMSAIRARLSGAAEAAGLEALHTWGRGSYWLLATGDKSLVGRLRTRGWRLCEPL